MVKPFKLFVLLLILLALLATTTLFIPPQGIKIGAYSLKYPSLLELFDLDSANRPSDFSLHPELALLDQMLDSISTKSFIDTLGSRLIINN